MDDDFGDTIPFGDDHETIAKARKTADHFAAVRARHAPPSTLIPGYRILREIHRGGQGVVYEAKQLGTGRNVAIKVMHEGRFIGPRARERFQQEVRLLARLKHPNIVTIHDSGTVDGGHYFVMDYIQGEPLDAHIARTAPTVESTLLLFLKICEAVNSAHLHGILHRDLKPSNIRIDERVEPHILDFGLAKYVAEMDDATRAKEMTITGQFVGSLPWASPEQVDGAPVSIDLRADVYSLGVVLYQALTGQFPYMVAGKMREVVNRILDAEPVGPSRRSKEIDDEVETIVLKCLAKDPERRYQSAGELARDVQRYLADEAIEAKRDSALYVLRKRLQRYRVAVAGGVAFVLLLAISSAVGWRLYAQSQRNLWKSYLAQARATQAAGRAGRRFDALDAIAKAAAIKPTFELRNEAVAAIALADVRTITEWDPGPGWELAVFSPNLRYYALQTRVGSSWSVRRVSDRAEVLRFDYDNDGAWGNLTFSADSRLCAGATESEYEIWSLDPPHRVLTVPAPFLDLHHVDFSPDGTHFAICARDGIRVYDLKQLDHRLLEYAGATHVGARYSPDGSRLATWSHRDTRVSLHDALTGKVLAELDHLHPVWYLAWHPAGTLLATGSDDGRIYLWDTENAKPRLVLTEAETVEVHLDFSYRRDVLMSSGWDNATHFWDVQTGSHILRWRGNAVGFARDSDRLGYGHWAGGRATLSIAEFSRGAVATITDYQPNAQTKPVVYDLALLERGRVVAAARSDGIHFWDTQTRKKLGHMNVGPTTSLMVSNEPPAVISAHPHGLYRWPLERKGNTLRIGPPVPIWSQQLSATGWSAELSGDGSRVAFVANNERAVVMDVDDRGNFRYVGEHPHLRFVSLNRDGSRLATSTWHGHGVKVWDVARDELLYELDIPGATRTFFTSNDEWLITSNGSENCIWDAHTGALVRRFERANLPALPGAVACSPDGRMLAMMDDAWTIRLYDTANLTPLADLPTPDQSRIHYFGVAFSADGNRLVLTSEHNQTIFVWDLAKVRNELSAMNLDWKEPPFTSAPSQSHPEPITLSIELADLAPSFETAE